ncbi:MAG: hypothetical protein EOM67_16130 [Spirochaetia bacterium]|nr:hypothetical protein [Spirochaetia bacterium]
MVIDAHGHLGHWSFPVESLSSEGLIKQMDQYNIDYTIVSSSLAVRYDIKGGNEELHTELKKHPRLKGYVTVNLHYPKESIYELYKYLDMSHSERLFIGVKIHPMMNNLRFDSSSGMLIAKAINDLDVPVLIHTYGSEIESPKQVVEVMKHFEHLKIILAHSGGFDWQLAVLISQNLDQV